MLSIKYIREHPDKVKAAAKHKNREVDIDRIIQLDSKKSPLFQKSQKLREERNKLAKRNPSDDVIERGRELKQELRQLEAQIQQIDSELYTLLTQVPNVPLAEVPIGQDESDNQEIRKHGAVPKSTSTPKSHIDLVEDLHLADLKRGSKVSGFRGYFLKNQAAQLHFALLFFVFQKLISKGYAPLIAPSKVKRFTLFGNGQFPWGEREVYKLNEDDAYLAGTAEVPVTAYHADEILEESELPKKYVAFSPCFRREAGSHGKDTRGLYRLHEFWKVEQVIVAPADLELAKKLHEELQHNCEEILQQLEIPYRVMLMCTGDMGEPQIKKYDTEAWMPSRGGYGEVASNSIMGDFQARRLKIRYRGKDGKKRYCYTLNNTAIASPRILIALLENHQTADGSIDIPAALQPLTGFDKIEAATKKE